MFFKVRAHLRFDNRHLSQFFQKAIFRLSPLLQNESQYETIHMKGCVPPTGSLSSKAKDSTRGLALKQRYVFEKHASLMTRTRTF